MWPTMVGLVVCTHVTLYNTHTYTTVKTNNIDNNVSLTILLKKNNKMKKLATSGCVLQLARIILLSCKKRAINDMKNN